MAYVICFTPTKLLQISEITKRVGNYFSCRFIFFELFLIPNSRYKNEHNFSVIAFEKKGMHTLCARKESIPS